MRPVLIFSIMCPLVLVIAATNICIGGVSLDLGDILNVLIRPGEDLTSFIVWNIRLPRTIATITGGAILSVSGLLLQVYFRNPIVGPFILGISSGATLMVSIVMLTSISFSLPLPAPYVTTIFAMIGAFMVILLVMGVAARVRSGITLLIVGLMVGYLCHAVTSILMAFAEKQQIKGFILWQLGSFNGFKWDEIRLLIGLGGFLMLLSIMLSKPLNALLLGEDYAMSMGINVKRTRVIVLSCACALAGLITSMAGPVAFIGLAVPHMSRMIFATSDNRILLPGVMVIGALVTSLCDLVARSVLTPVELPLSAITAFFGAPVVISLLMKRRVDL